MLTYRGGDAVGKGTYWNVTSGRRVDVMTETVLAGGGAATYVKAPAGVALLSMPIIGLIYVIAMPILGIAAIASITGGRLLGLVSGAVGKTLSFGWRPRNAYLSGKKRKKHDSK